MNRSVRPLACLTRIIGALVLLALSGCGALRLGYSSAPTLTYWWLDGYVDINAEQAPLVREKLAALYDWHRKTELPAYADTLAKIEPLMAGPVTADQVCAIWPLVQEHGRQFAVGLAGPLSEFTPLLQAKQLRYLVRKYDKNNRKFREEWIDVSPQELYKVRLEKGVEWTEMLYGRVDETQKQIIRQNLDRSSYDPRVVYKENLRRQSDILQVLREHSTEGKARSTHVRAEVLALMERLRVSPDAEYRAYFEKTTAEACADIAAVHNSTSKAQRANAVKTLQEYQALMRSMAKD
jgi:Family of unknown function (DUF6279)